MKPKTNQSPESVVREIKRKTRRKFNSEEKIRIILEGLKGEESIANICRREGIAPRVCTMRGAKRFWRQASSVCRAILSERPVAARWLSFAKENEQLKQLVAELSLRNRVLKKSLSGLD